MSDLLFHWQREIYQHDRSSGFEYHLNQNSPACSKSRSGREGGPLPDEMISTDTSISLAGATAFPCNGGICRAIVAAWLISWLLLVVIRLLLDISKISGIGIRDTRIWRIRLTRYPGVKNLLRKRHRRLLPVYSGTSIPGERCRRVRCTQRFPPHF